MTPILSDKRDSKTELDRVGEGLAAREAERAELTQKVARLLTEADQAAAEAIRDDPLSSPWAATSRATQLERERKNAEVRLSNVARETTMLEEQARVLARQDAMRRLEEAKSQARAHDPREKAALAKMAEGWNVFVRGYLELVSEAKGREAIHADLQREGLVELLSETERAEYAYHFKSVLTNFPATLSTAANWFVRACGIGTDREGTVNGLNPYLPVLNAIVPLVADIGPSYHHATLNFTDVRKDFSSPEQGRTF